ncbi:MAG TPA: serine/threonine-protein kinase [Bryobacteraceae bacterium]|nr:serine/threonine-protein kinase [Bryobacteraceae bacterium]
MKTERRRQIEQLYRAALQQEEEQRESFLATACRDDEELHRQVANLLTQSGLTLALVDQSAREETEGHETPTVLEAGTKLGPYHIVGPLGEGGMGKVYRAVDTRLGRAVAIKISAEEFSKRFEREARTISALNHPQICTLYDIGSLPSGFGYMVTELVEGETLRDWLKHSSAADQGVRIARQILEALRAAHGVGIVHRDLKPANIMVRFDGYVKVLDFGLARRIPMAGTFRTEETATAGLSLPGEIVGTAAYMSPEQILGQEVDQRSDLFAFGIILYEILTGQHPWTRKSTVDTLHAILHDEPPPRKITLAGVVDKLLRKDREERYPSAEAVLEAFASPRPVQTVSTGVLTRLIVLPFRILRQHDASDFLSVSLPDAITNSLTAIDSLVVRSTMTARRFAAAPELDVKMISEQAQVDAILTGTILSDGENLRVTTQLVQSPDGKLLWSNTSQATLRNIFQLQDDLVERIVQSLTLPLTAREHRALKHDVPGGALAYECYLRGNQLAVAGDLQSMTLARDLYRRCVDDDAAYAPAWAALGRIYRFLAKYGVDRAGNFAASESAFQKAFRLNPDLALAHNFYTLLETDLGRSPDAMERLLKRAHSHRNDPNVFAGLVHACRYCGLLEASVAAHERARQLDPNVQTSVPHTYTILGAPQKALDSCGPTDMWIRPKALMALGRKEEAIEQLRAAGNANPWVVFWRTLFEGDRQKSLDALNRAQTAFPVHTSDPEARFFNGCLLAELNETGRALEFLSLALDEGYHCHYALLHDPDLEPLRSHQLFPELVNRAAALDRHARAVFLDNGGNRLLGVRPDGTLRSAPN